jgi:hypothetical protein
VIPRDTKVAILEDASEEDYNSEEAELEDIDFEIESKDLTVQSVANEIFE